jgi:hypothetical protein
VTFFDISGDFIVFVSGGFNRFVYQLVSKPGWVLVTITSGGLPSLRGESWLGEQGMLMVAASDTLLFGKVMASDHLVRPCSVATKHIGVSDMLLLVLMKISDAPSSRGWSASMSLLRSSATRTTGIVL